MLRTACLFLLLLLGQSCILVSPLLAQTTARPAPTFGRQIRPLLAAHCFRCHGPKKQEADLRLDNLDPYFSKGDFSKANVGSGAAAETWHDVLNKLNLGEMPPEDEPQPSADELQQIVDWLTSELKRAADAKRNTGGQVVLRRLTRYEYNNTMRDLLGIDLDFAVDLPPEPTSEDGFQNSGAALRMSPLQIELYLRAARSALAKAIVTGPEPEVFHHHIEKSITLKRKKTATSNRLTPGVMFVARMLEYPREGEFVVRVKAGSIVPDGVGHPRMRLTLGIRSDVLTAEQELGDVDVTASADDPQVYEFRGRIEQFPLPGHNPKFPGVMITVWNDYGNPPKKQK